MSDSVGTIKIGLDIEVGSSVSKHIEQVSNRIASNLKSSIEGSSKSIAQDLSKSVSNSTKEATKAATKVGKEVTKSLQKSIDVNWDKVKIIDHNDIDVDDKVLKQIENVQRKYADAFTSGSSNKEVINKAIAPPTAKYTAPSSINQSTPDGALDLAVKRDNLQVVLEGRIKQFEELRQKMANMEVGSPDFAKAQVQYGSLSQTIENTTGKIRGLDEQIKNYDTNQLEKENMDAAESTSKLGRAFRKTSKSLGNNGYSGAVKKASSSSAMMGRFGKSMVRNLLGLNLMLSIVSRGVRSLASGFLSSLKTNNQFNDSLKQIKSNLSTAFQPIFNAILPAINSLMRGLSKVTAYIAGFTSALFGKSVKSSNASAKAMGKAKDSVDAYGKSVKEAQQIHAGFDQLNDVTENKDVGGGAGPKESAIIPINLDEADMSFIDKVMNKTKDVIKKAFESSPVQAFVNFGKTALTEYQAHATRVMGAIGSNSKATFQEMWPYMYGGLNNVSELWTNFFNDLTAVTTTWSKKITDQVVLLVNNISNTFRPFFVLVSKMWEDWSKIILDLWNKYGKRIADGIAEFIVGAVDTFNKIWTHIIDPIIRPAVEFMADIWDSHLKDIIFSIGDFIGNAIARALDLYNKFIKPVIDWLVVNLGPAFVTTFNLISGTVGGVMKGILTTVSDIIGSIRKVFDGLMDFLEGVFSGDWKKVWEGMSKVFGGVFDGLKALFKAPINWIIEGLNGFIKGINKVEIPKWVPLIGGKGFNIAPLVPLASGAVLTQPTPALMGEYPGARSNPEIVTPESLMRQVVNDAIAANSSKGGDSNQPIIIRLEIGGMKFFETIIELGKQYALQTGEQVIFVG